MEAIGQLTGGVAHDFNNLLTVIKSSSDLLKRPGLSEERRDRFVEAISLTVDRAAKLTGQLLAFARRQALQPKVFDAGMSIQSLAEMVRTITGSHIAVTTHYQHLRSGCRPHCAGTRSRRRGCDEAVHRTGFQHHQA
jgi:signal transduction histidine kinase